jgi:alpha-D-ribose 1-methylphosphonate 5-triphosphate diphosphatase
MDLFEEVSRDKRGVPQELGIAAELATPLAAAAGTTVICGGDVVLADRVATSHDVLLREGRIIAIEPSRTRAPQPGLTIIEATGRLVAPGFIDIHSDYIETVASPRPTVVLDLAASLYGADRELVAHGVTTIFHSLSVYQLLVFDHKPIRRFENVMRLIELINLMRAREGTGHLIRHRVHLRVELDAVQRLAAIEASLRAGDIDLLSFMDHTPGQGQYRDLELFSKVLRSYRRELDENAVREIVNEQQQGDKLGFSDMRHLATLAHEHGVVVASHDDDSTAKLDFMEEVGVSISEFPISLEVAHSARLRGMHCIAGAPNVLMGCSHSGNLSAREAVCAQASDILCSDYCPAALLHAVFELHRSCGLGLAEAFALVTRNPADAVGLGGELGEIAEGRRGDILVIAYRENVQGGDAIPVVERVFVEGHPVFAVAYPQANRPACNCAA